MENGNEIILPFHARKTHGSAGHLFVMIKPFGLQV
jgi:hypothetical protein